MVDSAFSEWDKAFMFNVLQQCEQTTRAGQQDGCADGVRLKAISSLLLNLILIPTLSGVILID